MKYEIPDWIEQLNKQAIEARKEHRRVLDIRKERRNRLKGV